MSTAILQLREQLGLHAPSTLSVERAWSRRALAGRLVELSGHGASSVLTAAMGLLLDAQLEGEPAAWIGSAERMFFPPDAAQSGVDLAALAMVRVADARTAARAADRLLRSGAFGLVVLDLGSDSELPMPLQSRLVALAQKHDAAVLCLTHKPARSGSIGSLVSLRGEATRQHLGAAAFACEVMALKDKRHGPGLRHREVCHAPPGLR